MARRRIAVWVMVLVLAAGGCDANDGQGTPDADARDGVADAVRDATGDGADAPEEADGLPPDGDAVAPETDEVTLAEVSDAGPDAPDATDEPDAEPPPVLTGAEFTVLPDFAGSAEESTTTATDVSADGLVLVGTGWGSSFNNYEAFRWTAATGMVGLGRLPGHNVDSRAVAVSRDGATVVGVSRHQPVVGGDIEYVPYRWTEATGLVALSLGEPGEASSAWVNGANAVTDGGVVVGNARWRPVRWLADGTRQALSDLNGFGSGVSADGSVAVGEVVLGYDGAGIGIVRAFRWTEAGGLVLLKDGVGQEVQSNAYDVSDDGTVVVGQCHISVATGPQACRWTEETGLVGLGRLPGHALSVAQAVSGDGRLVAGQSCTPSNGGAPCWGFIWTKEGGLVHLGKLLAVGGAVLGEHHVGRVLGASADGRVLAGEAHVGVGTYPEIFALRAVLPQ